MICSLSALRSSCNSRPERRHIVGVLFSGTLETQVIENVGAERGPGEVSARGKKTVPEMLREQAGNGVEQPRENGEPCGLKMKRASPTGGTAEHGGKRKIE